MALARSVNFETVNELLTKINQESAQAASSNLQSTQVHLEDTFRDLLNCLHGTHLVNANSVSMNYPGIDLIDESSLLCIQVTANTSAKKMRETLAKPIMKSLSEKGYRLKFCYVGDQNKNVKRRHPENPYGIKFSASSDVILTTDILAAFNHLDLDRQEEVIALLRREVGEGCVIDADQMREMLSRATKQLGPRYTPDANVETPDMMRLAALAGDELFRKDLLKKAQSAATGIDSLMGHDIDEADKDALAEVTEFFSPLTEVLADIPKGQAARTDFEEWALRLNAAAGECSQYPANLFEKVRSRGRLATTFQDALYRVWAIGDACHTWGIEYLGGKRVLVCGEAGIGKSHLLADLCEKELENGNAAVLVLGSQFVEEGSSEESIPKILGLSGSFDDLLAEMQRYAHARRGIAILAIDALNEGRGRVIWRHSLLSLIDKVSHHSLVRLVLSVRSTYKAEVIPDSLSDDEIGVMECKGFGEVSSVALETLCDYYNIAYPTTPLIGMEFSNPLYLKLLCRHLYDCGGHFTTDVEMGDLVTGLLAEINNKLADSQRANYDRRIPLVARAAQAIVRSPGFFYGAIDYEKAERAVIEVVRDYVSPPGSFLEGLVSEGLFNVLDGEGSSYLTFSYDLVGNYVVAAMVVERAKELQRIGRFASSAEALSSLLNEEYGWISGDQGALAALSAICPTECECELFELDLNRNGAFSPVREAFVEGIPWRRTIEVTPDLDNFIRTEVLADKYSMHDFISMSFQLATKRGGIDVKYFRDLLLPLPMSKRDYVWSSTVATSAKAASFVDWVWKHGGELDERHVENIAILLTLCLAATNIMLRRKAIKALALVLINCPSVASCLWDVFCSVDDDYILEGLCGAIFGAAVNSSDLGIWTTTADKVVSAVLNEGEAYPNIAVRDYVVLLSDSVLESHFMQSCLSEPFVSSWRSDWYDSLPSNEEIDAFLEACEEKYGKKSKEASAVWWLIHSMVTEYGRGTCAYGDFGRYVFGHRVSAWVNQFESDQQLSNALVAQILTKWYDPDLHAGYDVETKRREGSSLYTGCERIGKKYQKIAMNRLLARLMDNYSPYRTNKIYREGFEEYSEKRAALLKESISLGDYSAFSKVADDVSDWVVGERHEPLNRGEVGNELLFVRSHDPSFPWKWSSLASPYNVAEAFPSFIPTDGDPDEWCKSDAEISTVDGFRIRQLDGRRFYTIAAYIKWQMTKRGKRCRESTWISGALFVGKNDISDVFGHYSGRSTSLDFTGVRFGELFDGWGFGLSNSVHQSELFELENKVTEASYLYDWSEDREELQGEGPCILLPCAALVNYFGLFRRGPFIWENASGEIVSYCLIDQETESRALLFDADLLNEYLDKTARELIWDDYFEKQTARLIYRKWINTKVEDGQFCMEDTEEPYCGEAMRAHWMSEDGWFDA